MKRIGCPFLYRLDLYIVTCVLQEIGISGVIGQQLLSLEHDSLHFVEFTYWQARSPTQIAISLQTQVVS
jgi:hypothetical protein